ncbi:MAG: hypothetical protein IKI22_03040, partial [Neisseriaceae bacterium]|nr:hypothetical protein [Neisseriaceae bacterium]
SVILSFFEKTYALGNKKEQSQAALLASMRIMSDSERNIESYSNGQKKSMMEIMILIKTYCYCLSLTNVNR